MIQRCYRPTLHNIKFIFFVRPFDVAGEAVVFFDLQADLDPTKTPT